MADKNYVLLYDTLTLDIPDIHTAYRDKKKVDFSFDKFKDDAEGKPHLVVTANSCHSGCLYNHRTYPGALMAKSTGSWTKPYQKPVLSRHPVAPSMFHPGDAAQPDVFGRVFKAKYFRLVQNETDFNEDFKNPDPKGEGSGYIQTQADITDQGAIEKFLDKRFLTLSTGQRSPNMICSVCGQDWAVSRTRCDHWPGETYDVEIGEGKKKRKIKVKMYFITGVLDYDHWATVNSPADKHAVIVGMDLKDSEDAELFKAPRDVADLPRAEIVALTLMDERGPIHLCLDEDTGGHDAVLMSVANISLPGSPEPVQGTKDAGDSKSDQSNEGDMDPNADKDKDKKPAEPAQAPESADTPKDADPKDKNDGPSEDELANINIIGSIIESGGDVDWVAAGISEEEKQKVLEQDKKLTAATRKALPGKVFCGPNRSFPVHDCAHYANAKSRLHVYKGPGSKSSILSCIERRGKALGCPTAKGKGKDADVQTQKTDTGEIAKVRQECSNLRASLDAKTAEVKDLLDMFVDLDERYRRLVAANIISLKAALGRPGSKFESEDALNAAIEDLAAKTLDYLEPTLEELRAETPAGKEGRVQDPTAVHGDVNKDEPVVPGKKEDKEPDKEPGKKLDPVEKEAYGKLGGGNR